MKRIEFRVVVVSVVAQHVPALRPGCHVEGSQLRICKRELSSDPNGGRECGQGQQDVPSLWNRRTTVDECRRVREDSAGVERVHSEADVQRVERLRAAVEHLQGEARVVARVHVVLRVGPRLRPVHRAVDGRGEGRLDAAPRVHLDRPRELMQEGLLVVSFCGLGRDAQRRPAGGARKAWHARLCKLALQGVVLGVAVVEQGGTLHGHVEDDVAVALRTILRDELVVAHDHAVEAPPSELRELLEDLAVGGCSLADQEAVDAQLPAVARGAVEPAVDRVEAQAVVARAHAGDGAVDPGLGEARAYVLRVT